MPGMTRFRGFDEIAATLWPRRARDDGPFVSSSKGEPIIVCQRCGYVPLSDTLSALRCSSRSAVIDAVYALLAEHEHPASKPLAPRTREQIRTLAIHRRGAWRLTASGRV